MPTGILRFCSLKAALLCTRFISKALGFAHGSITSMLQHSIFCLKNLLPAAQFSGQRCVDFALAFLVRVIPERIVAMTIVSPTRMIEDGIETDAVQ